MEGEINMFTDKPNMLAQNEDVESLGKQIKQSLKNFVSDEIFDTWIDNFVFEEIDSNNIVVGYYGKEPLKEFDKKYKETVRLHICSVLGYEIKLIIHKRRGKMSVLENPRIKKNIKTAKFFLMSMTFAAIAIAFVVITCNYIVNRNFRETFYSVSSLKVDRSIRVVDISDLHSCLYGKDNQKIITRVKKLEPDLIICSGDIIDSKSKQDRMDSIAKMCSQLSKIAPSYYIYGNNEVEKIYGFDLTKEVLDSKFGFDDYNRNSSELLNIKDKFEKQLERGGIKVLKNEMDTITVGGTQIDVFGVLTSNASSFWPYAGGSFGDYIYSNPDNLKITAIHEPFIFEDLDENFWGDLMVCGHTHGGTIRVPIFGPLYTHEGGLFPERNGDYVYGRYDVSGRPLILSCGMENANLLRINNQPELVVIDINKF